MPDVGHTSLRRKVWAGPLSAVVDGSFLRYVRAGEREVLRGVYVAFRDHTWGTIEPRFTAYQVEQGVDSFLVRFTAEHISDQVDFVWDGLIRGDSDGTLNYSMDGLVRRTLQRNRIGFCILHGLDFAGMAVRLETPHGPSTGVFPERIAPHQPMFDIQAMRYQTGGVDTELRFEGDLFEMEDQRNWTDASYKTYCTPLRLPYPVEVEAGTRIHQSVSLSVHGALTQPTATEAASTPVWIGNQSVGRLPPVGLGVASHARALSASETDELLALRLAHLRAPIDVLRPDWATRLDVAAEQARALNVPLELDVSTDEAGRALDDLILKLTAEQTPLARVLVFDRATSVTARGALERLSAVAHASGVTVPLGGGSCTHFTEFNRARLPVDLLDVATYPITPQVHAFDNTSIVETLAAQPVTVASARHIVGDIPLSIGPITLKPRLNSAATAAPESDSSATAELPRSVDPRQASLLAAGWTVGSLHALSASGANWLTYYETTGWGGLLNDAGAPRQAAFAAPPGTTYPVYHVIADVAGFSGADVLHVGLGDGLVVQALALRSGSAVRLLVANVTDADQAVTLHVPPLASARVRMLDETSAHAAAQDPRAFRTRVDRLVDGPLETLELQLRPWGILRLDAQPVGW